jgi:uncharacterized membrane protein YfcA
MYAVCRRFVTSPLLLCILVGFASGALNVVAGGGSFFTLPLLLFLGLPAADANGTNRVGVLAQNMSGVWGFHQHQVVEWKWGVTVSVPALIGAAIGAWIAIQIPDFAFRRVLSVVMLVMTVGTLLQRRWLGARLPGLRSPRHWTMVAGFFLAGLYGGFIQAGIGFLILALTTIAGMDLVRGNAVKLLCVMLLTLLALAIFGGTGHVNWPLGLALGLGNFLGGLVGVRVAVMRGHKWLEGVITVVIVLCAIWLWATE